MEPVKLIRWKRDNVPNDNMLWKKAALDQLDSFRKIAGVLAKDFEEFEEIQENIMVISSHTSKSIELPVCRIRWNGWDFIMRNNFYDWKITVRSPEHFKLIIDFMDIFNIDEEINECYCEGFDNKDVLGSYSENHKSFTISLSHKYLVTFFYILKYKYNKYMEGKWII